MLPPSLSDSYYDKKNFLSETQLQCDLSKNLAIDLYSAINEFDLIGLKHSKQWCTDMLMACKDPLDAELPAPPNICNLFGDDLKHYLRAKSLFDMEEYQRAELILQDTTTKGCKLLMFYSRYMRLCQKATRKGFEKVMSAYDHRVQPQMADLRIQIKKSVCDDDPFTCFLLGCVAKYLKKSDEALEYFGRAVNFQPHLWAAWSEMITLVSSRQQLQSLSLPNHWTRSLFYAHCLCDLECPKDALAIYDRLLEEKFTDTSSYLMEQKAHALFNLGAFEGSSADTGAANTAYQQLRRNDPYNLNFVDHYSNLLYVMYDRPALSLLAQQCHEINPYRHETCCVLGNYFSLVKEHGKSVHYYVLALKANPQYVFAWTLTGHECMELKNYNSAVLAYRKAIELDPKEYRAWYGVGQAYEIMKMPKYALHYYMKAHQIRPLDRRFLVALGDTYTKLGSAPDAIRCFWKAYSVGDDEHLALTRLAMTYRNLSDDESAVRLYLRYLEEIKSFVNSVDQEELCDVLRYLGSYYERQDDLTGLDAVLRWGLDVTKNPTHTALLSPVISQLAAVTTNEFGSRVPRSVPPLRIRLNQSRGQQGSSHHRQ